MDSTKPTGRLRLAYRVGAAADGIAAAVMLGQAVFGFESALIRHVPDPAYRYAMGLGGSLMLGWTILLLWADRKPYERRGVLAITIVVILGLMSSSATAAIAGLATRSAMVPVLALQAGLIGLFVVALRKANA